MCPYALTLAAFLGWENGWAATSLGRWSGAGLAISARVKGCLQNSANQKKKKNQNEELQKTFVVTYTKLEHIRARYS
jgi:hypothetical protein